MNKLVILKLPFLKYNKCKNDKTENDFAKGKLIIVDMLDNSAVADLTGAAGVSECEGISTIGTTLPPTTNLPATAANKSTQGMSTNLFVGKKSSTDDSPDLTDSEDVESDNDDEEMASNTSTKIKTEKESVTFQDSIPSTSKF